MKISLAWMFDHIDADWHQHSIDDIVLRFNQKVAEIEHFFPVAIALDQLCLGLIKGHSDEILHVYLPEMDQTVSLPYRDGFKIDSFYLIKKNNTGFEWAQADLFGGSDGVVPELYCTKEQASDGSWKDMIESHDYIIEIDNKSITHRPDMWGHRGCAREVAAILDLPLKPIEQMVHELPVISYQTEAQETQTEPFSIRLQEPKYNVRFSAVYFQTLANRACLPWMASRLYKVGTRPIAQIVDMTNYVMFDIGQPMHAFDAQTFSKKHLEPRFFKDHRLKLLDGHTITTTPNDLVVTDGKHPVALAGVMGSYDTQVTEKTGAVLLEAAHFDATMVRVTAAHHKKRTEASARFEKILDPEYTIIALQRFVRLLDDAQVPYEVTSIVSVGKRVLPEKVSITHEYIVDRLGASISQKEITDILHRLGFQVTVEQHDDGCIYHVAVPTFRSYGKSVHKEDLLEEIARLFGYHNIPQKLPYKQTTPSDMHALYAMRYIKRMLASGHAMHEVSHYAFYDEDFLRELQWRPESALSVQSPVSKNWQLLVTSLVPGLLKTVAQNHTEHDRLRFFEQARVWPDGKTNDFEKDQLAAVVYEKSVPVSFYTIQSIVADLVHMIGMDVVYEKIEKPDAPWFVPHQTAHIKHNGIVIGTVGVLDGRFYGSVFQGYAAAFICDASYITSYVRPVVQYTPLPKYPVVQRDMSIMIATKYTMQELKNRITGAHDHIVSVRLVDMFQKDDWRDRKSLTFSIAMRDANKTLTTQEADVAYDAAVQAVLALGASIR